MLSGEELEQFLETVKATSNVGEESRLASQLLLALGVREEVLGKSEADKRRE